MKTPDDSKNGAMLTVLEYAEKYGYSRKTVCYLCERGRLAGAIKVKSEKGAFNNIKYLIPEDSTPNPPLIRHAPHEKKTTLMPKREPKKVVLASELDKSLHIQKFAGTKSVKRLAEETGLSVEEVRNRYERLLQNGKG